MSLSNTLEGQTELHLRQMVRATGIPIKTLAEAMGLKTSEALNWWSNQGQRLSFKNIQILADYIGVSVDNLIARNYSFDLVRKRIFNGPASLPDVYSEQASSFVRSSAHIVEYLAMTYGRHFIDRLLMDLNVHPMVFEDLDNRINLNFFIDLLNHLSKVGVPEEEIDSLACYVFLGHEKTTGSPFESATSYMESYAVLEKYITKLESNFAYKFELSPNRIRITAEPTEAWLFLENKPVKEYERLIKYRKKVIGWFPILSNLPPIQLRTPKCILRGDDFTIYEATFDNIPAGKKTESLSHLSLLRSFPS